MFLVYSARFLIPHFLVAQGLNVGTRPGPFCTYPTCSADWRLIERASRCSSLVLIYRWQEQAVSFLLDLWCWDCLWQEACLQWERMRPTSKEEHEIKGRIRWHRAFEALLPEVPPLFLWTTSASFWESVSSDLSGLGFLSLTIESSD